MDNEQNVAIDNVEQNDAADNVQGVAEEDVQSTIDEEAPRGILYEYSLKYAEKLAKKEKRKGIMQFIKYALCAASAGIIQIVLFTILQAVIPQSNKTIHFITDDMDVVTFVSTTVALCASILWNFTFNRKFTFKDASNVPKAMALAFLFYVPFYPFQTWYVHTIKQALLGSIGDDGAGIIAEGTVMIINFALEFLWQKFVVFREKKEVVQATEGEGTAIDETTLEQSADEETALEQSSDGEEASLEQSEIAPDSDVELTENNIDSNAD